MFWDEGELEPCEPGVAYESTRLVRCSTFEAYQILMQYTRGVLQSFAMQ
jgi:hypothetical protein